MAEVHLKDLRKSFGKSEVVHGVNAEIAEGEFLVIVGPSGCGKSTILRMIAGLEDVTSGQILIDGKTVNDLEPKQRDIAMVFQNYALYPHMSVFANMAYSLKVRKTPKAEQRRRVDEAAKILGLSDMLERRPRQLSGGQRQRVAMGRAIVREPSVFLFDEPLSNLDAKLRNQMRVELKKLHRRLGHTSIYVTHDQIEAMTLADRILVIRAGHMEQLAGPTEIYEQPATHFVARFIGSPAMNMLKAEVGEDRLNVRVAERINLKLRRPLSQSGHFTLGIRPEDLSLSEEEDRTNAFQARVDLVEPLGSDTVIHCGIEEMEDALIARLPGSARITSGENILLGLDATKLHFFDPDSGTRVRRTRSRED